MEEQALSTSPSRSPFPDVEIPTSSLWDFVFEHSDRFANNRATIDGQTGACLTYDQLIAAASEWQQGWR